MKTRSFSLVLSASALLVSAFVLWSTASRSDAAPPGAAPELVEAPLTPRQVELLDLAFETASALPVHPHLKDRSRAQASVVSACLELDQPRRAEEYAAKIEDWRRGAAEAELAFYSAKHGCESAARRFLEQALSVARGLRTDADEESGDVAQVESGQSWRADRIKVGVARTLALLGDDAKAEELETGVVESEMGKVDGVRARRLDAAAFDERLARLGEIIVSTHVEQAQTAMEECAQLYDRFYGDPPRRERALQTIRVAGAKLPGTTRIEVMMELATCALDHGDAQNALAVVEEAKLITGACTNVPLVARLAGLRFRAGDAAKARAEADAALALYEQQRADIVNIYRSGVLRPLAEAYAAMGDRETALRVYRRALEEGVENPNSRPRAEDLAAICLSLARCKVEPDADLMGRVYEVNGGLGEPW